MGVGGREPEPHRKQVTIWLNPVSKTKLRKQNLWEDRKAFLNSASLSSPGRLLSSNSERKKGLDVKSHARLLRE